MSFGFSIGDFLAVGKLIAEIITSLQDAGGAKSDYQDLIRELECLGQVLRRLDKLQTQSPNKESLELIKYAALSCRRPLEDFLVKISQYEDTLGVRAKPSIFDKSSVHKIRWSLGKKEEATRLQGYLSVHIGTINILMAEHGLESLHLASRDAEGFHVHVRGTLEGMQRAMGSIEGNLAAQRHVVETTNSMLTTIYQMVCGDISTGLSSLMNMASAVCVRTQQIHGILIELKSSFQSPDTRWTWFQEPLKVEDALGVKFPIPAEYNFDLINVIIKTRFKNGPGSQTVQLGNYELVQARNSSQAISEKTLLRPGTHIIMAIIIDQHDDGVGKTGCPMPHCGSTETAQVPGGGRICSECQVTFSESNRKRKHAEDLVEQDRGQLGRLRTESSSEARCRSDFKHPERYPLADEEIAAYKNVRCSKPSVVLVSPPSLPFLSTHRASFVDRIQQRNSHNDDVSAGLVPQVQGLYLDTNDGLFSRDSFGPPIHQDSGSGDGDMDTVLLGLSSPETHLPDQIDDPDLGLITVGQDGSVTLSHFFTKD